MTRYRLFALDPMGRIDRGFEQQFRTDDDAIRFASDLDDAPIVEVMRGDIMVARVRHHNGRTTVIGGERVGQN